MIFCFGKRGLSEKIDKLEKEVNRLKNELSEQTTKFDAIQKVV
jgi:tetrahydromethanopterin S-methyltransferase subunit B